MYQHILIPTDGSELAERGVTHGLSLAKFVGAKVTAIIVEERPDAWWGIGGPFPNPGEGVAFVELTDEIKKHAASVRFAWLMRPSERSEWGQNRTHAATKRTLFYDLVRSCHQCRRDRQVKLLSRCSYSSGIIQLDLLPASGETRAAHAEKR